MVARKRIVYGNGNYADLVQKQGYFVDKAPYKFKTTLADFQLQTEDTEQINGYAVGLQQEFPRAYIERYVIYCVGNQGFRVFAVTTGV